MIRRKQLSHLDPGVDGTGKTIGFWKHQLSVAMKGKGRAQVSASTMQSYIDEIEEFYLSEPFQFDDANEFKAAHDILGLHVSDAARDLARMENKQVAEEAEANITEKVAGSAYSDWGAVTTGVSDTNPFDAIGASIDYIRSQGYPADFVAMDPTLWRKFILNTWVRDIVHAGLGTVGSTGGEFTLPGYPRMSFFVDPALTDTPTATDDT